MAILDTVLELGQCIGSISASIPAPLPKKESFHNDELPRLRNQLENTEGLFEERRKSISKERDNLEADLHWIEIKSPQKYDWQVDRYSEYNQYHYYTRIVDLLREDKRERAKFDPAIRELQREYDEACKIAKTVTRAALSYFDRDDYCAIHSFGQSVREMAAIKMKYRLEKDEICKEVFQNRYDLLHFAFYNYHAVLNKYGRRYISQMGPI